MSVQGELLEMLETVVAGLGDDLCQQMVFVGGCSTAVLITDDITLQDIRATDDVDLIIDLKGMTQWMRLQETLRDRGFTVSIEDETICRMRFNNLKVDFMPDDPDILGFSNRWYKQAIDTAITYTLPSGRLIKHLSAPLFLATKFEAYNGRGQNDPLGSHDLEDIVNVIDGRIELLEEVQAINKELRLYLSEKFQALTEHPDFENFVHGNIRGPEGRVEIVSNRIQALIDVV